MRELKGELLALMLAMHERIQSLEILQEQQNSAIQVCHWQHDTNHLVLNSQKLWSQRGVNSSLLVHGRKVSDVSLPFVART